MQEIFNVIIYTYVIYICQSEIVILIIFKLEENTLNLLTQDDHMILFDQMRSHQKITYEHCVYESVNNKSLS